MTKTPLAASVVALLSTLPNAARAWDAGDQGANQFNNKCLLNRAQDLPSTAQLEAQDWSFYTGKILRLELDGSIPEDNPVLAGVRSHVFSYGHRNVQGVVFGPGGTRPAKPTSASTWTEARR